MIERHRYVKSIEKSMSTLLKGGVKFSDRLENWSLNIEIIWSRKWLNVNVNSRNSDLKNNFKPFTLTQANFMGFITRSHEYNC